MLSRLLFSLHHSISLSPLSFPINLSPSPRLTLSLHSLTKCSPKRWKNCNNLPSNRCKSSWFGERRSLCLRQYWPSLAFLTSITRKNQLFQLENWENCSLFDTHDSPANVSGLLLSRSLSLVQWRPGFSTLGAVIPTQIFPQRFSQRFHNFSAMPNTWFDGETRKFPLTTQFILLEACWMTKKAQFLSRKTISNNAANTTTTIPECWN